MNDHGLMTNIFIYLSAAVIAIPLFKKLGLGSVLGYLAAGMIIGPWGIALISNIDDILHFAEFGVVLLLFLIGLELDPKRLWSLRHSIIGMGGAQVLITTLLFLGVSLFFSISFTHMLVIAMALSLSSTAIALQTMTEKNLLTTHAGKSAFSVLLFQDLAVIPMMAIIPLLAANDIAFDMILLLDIVKVIGVILLIIIGGHYLTEPVFHIIARTHMREIFTAFALMLVIGISLLMDMVGLSMALGSFLAGILLAESSFRHELEIEIEPFKGLLLGLFFMAIGMSINFGLLIEQPLLILLLVLMLLAIKLAVLMALSIFFNLPLKQRFMFSVLLSQGGEFAFVIFSLATSLSILPTHLSELIILVVAISMATTPLLLLLDDFFISSRFKQEKPEYDHFNLLEEHHPVIIAGFGRFGRVVGRLLHANKIPTTILDHEPDKIDTARQYGYQVYYGDVRKPALLESAGVKTAKLFILCIDDPEMSLEVVEMLKKNYPHLIVISRAYDMGHAFELIEKGIDDYHREMLESALALGESALKKLGYGAYEAFHARKVFTHHDKHLMHQLYSTEKLDKRISISIEARDELVRTLDADAQEQLKRSRDSWD